MTSKRSTWAPREAAPGASTNGAGKGAKRPPASAIRTSATCLPGSRANLDHLAIATSGVHVIDAKRYKGKIEVRKSWRGDARLLIAGRDKSKLVESLARRLSKLLKTPGDLDAASRQAVAELLAQAFPCA